MKQANADYIDNLFNEEMSNIFLNPDKIISQITTHIANNPREDIFIIGNLWARFCGLKGKFEDIRHNNPVHWHDNYAACYKAEKHLDALMKQYRDFGSIGRQAEASTKALIKSREFLDFYHPDNGLSVISKPEDLKTHLQNKLNALRKKYPGTPDRLLLKTESERVERMKLKVNNALDMPGALLNANIYLELLNNELSKNETHFSHFVIEPKREAVKKYLTDHMPSMRPKNVSIILYALASIDFIPAHIISKGKIQTTYNSLKEEFNITFTRQALNFDQATKPENRLLVRRTEEVLSSL